MNNYVKRSLCVLCALLVAFTFAVRPHAITGVDDALIVGTSAVALLFLSWCGITFGTNADAVAGVQASLENTVDGAKRLATIAEQYVADGTLKMTAAVKSAYMDLKDGIRKFFVADSVSLPTLSDTALSGFPAKNKIDTGSSITTNIVKYSQCMVSDLIGAKLVSGNTVYYGVYKATASSWTIRFLPEGQLDNWSYNGYKPIDWTFSTGETASSTYLCLYNPGYPAVHAYTYDPACKTYSDRNFMGSSDLLYLPVQRIIPFQQDKIVDGSSALKIFESLELPDPTPGQDPDPDNKPKEFPILPLETVVENGKSDKTDEQGNKVSEADPSLVPNDLVESLRKLLEQAQPNPDPDPDPDPTTPDDSGDQYGKKHDAKWAEVFPFCVPFDLIEFLNVLAADPEAPHFTWKFDFGEKLGQHELEIDLAAFDEVAQIVRTLELLAFCLGLILLTRNIIRG